MTKATPKTYQCSVCQKTFRAPTALGMHKRLKHGIEGQSASSVKYRAQKEEKAIVQVKPTPSNQKRVYTKRTLEETQRGDHLEATATFAAGRVTELLQTVAVQYDLPPRTLTALVIRVIHSQTLR